MVEKVAEGVVVVVSETEALVKQNKTALLKCETVIQRGENAFMAAAKAVYEIATKELYRGLYADKASYFRERWEMTKQQVNDYQNAGFVLVVLEDQGFDGERLPKNGGQCKELYSKSLVDDLLDEARLQTIWETVLASEEKITSKLIGDKASNLFPKQQTEQNVQPDESSPSTAEPSVAPTNREEDSSSQKETVQITSYVISLKVTEPNDRLTKLFRGEPKDGVYSRTVPTSDAPQLVTRFAAWFTQNVTQFNLKSFSIEAV
jgi:hypothetical protein